MRLQTHAACGDAILTQGGEDGHGAPACVRNLPAQWRPRRCQPWVRVMLVLAPVSAPVSALVSAPVSALVSAPVSAPVSVPVSAQVSSTNTRRAGPRRTLIAHPPTATADYVRPILLADEHTFFLKLMLLRRRKRQSVSQATTTPRSASSARRACSVRSGFSSRRANNHFASPACT
jgi:hypothetical protein